MLPFHAKPFGESISSDSLAGKHRYPYILGRNHVEGGNVYEKEAVVSALGLDPNAGNRI